MYAHVSSSGKQGGGSRPMHPPHVSATPRRRRRVIATAPVVWEACLAQLEMGAKIQVEEEKTSRGLTPPRSGRTSRPPMAVVMADAWGPRSFHQVAWAPLAVVATWGRVVNM
eukprot:TRINITY_DN298_c0_g1_i8.p3 TRINITY_DN298_c0_g1~~TRINITY_DN298_c0_g1_i8.p3  ORF type:complete len:112 (-),score=9.87 TRINITY_DN298_c0_g1_i8:430-765(-)